jgi:hypothetical protein
MRTAKLSLLISNTNCPQNSNKRASNKRRCRKPKKKQPPKSQITLFASPQRQSQTDAGDTRKEPEIEERGRERKKSTKRGREQKVIFVVVYGREL